MTQRAAAATVLADVGAERVSSGGPMGIEAHMRHLIEEHKVRARRGGWNGRERAGASMCGVAHQPAMTCASMDRGCGLNSTQALEYVAPHTSLVQPTPSALLDPL